MITQPTEQDLKEHRYIVSFVIDVKRTDGALLTDEENAMVDKMRVATEQAIQGVMIEHGNNNYKHLGSDKRVY